jgi:hypothetical protein
MNRSVTWSLALKVWLWAIAAYFVIAIASLLLLSLLGVIGGGVVGAFSGSSKMMEFLKEITIERAGVVGHYVGLLILLLGSLVAIKFALEITRIEANSTKNGSL